MSKPTKRKVAGGRVTPKGTVPPKPKGYMKGAGGQARRDEIEIPEAQEPVERIRYSYNPEVVSPTWVPVLMFSLLILGAVMIILNYMSWLPAAPTNWYLIGGLGLVLGGIVTATKLH